MTRYFKYHYRVDPWDPKIWYIDSSHTVWFWDGIDRNKISVYTYADIIDFLRTETWQEVTDSYVDIGL